MALEAEGGNFGVAINTGVDGDLSRGADWKVLYRCAKSYGCFLVEFSSSLLFCPEPVLGNAAGFSRTALRNVGQS
jgi:hypothetical protein